MPSFLIAFIWLCLQIENIASFPSINFNNINIADELNEDEFRTINGDFNNQQNPSYGAAGSDIIRCVPPSYGDGFNSLAGMSRENPRVISNLLSSQVPEDAKQFINDRFLTNFAWQWGQFIDHDITFISEDTTMNDPNQEINIDIPCGDPTFDPSNMCIADDMEFFRTFASGNSGTDINNPRIQKNDITAFIDGSMVYGSDDARAVLLRTLSGGKLKTSESKFGETLLPKNTLNLPNAPDTSSNFPIAGDVRASETLGLLAMHTIFVRAHNEIADMIIDSVRDNINNNGDTEAEIDEKVYQYTRVILTAVIQKITYNDWLPVIFGQVAYDKFIGEYQGYDESINPGICTIFSSSAFRLGHTMLPWSLPIRDEDCRNTGFGGGDLELQDAFFTPNILDNTPDFFEGFVTGFSCTLCNEGDTRVTEGVRNFLFQSHQDEDGEPIFGILDLVSLNLQRGRDHGLPDYNTVRRELGLDAIEVFDDLSSDELLNNEFKMVYKDDVNDIDLYMGGLAEDHMEDSTFGELISKIVLEQFKRLRDGDRYYYQRYIKDGDLKDWIESITLKDIFETVTNVEFNIEEDSGSESSDGRRRRMQSYDGAIMFQNSEAVSIFDEVSSSSSDSGD